MYVIRISEQQIKEIQQKIFEFLIYLKKSKQY